MSQIQPSLSCMLNTTTTVVDGILVHVPPNLQSTLTIAWNVYLSL